jgi:HSP20 family protein
MEGENIMAITRYEPFREFAALQDRMHRLFGDTYLQEDEASRGTWVPPVDIYETDDHDLVLKAEVPDISRDAIHVTVENKTLTLRGEKKFSHEVKEDQFRRVERSYGNFSRSFTLPDTVDLGQVKADYRDGVLTVRVPFLEEAKPRSIDVDVAVAG